MNIVFETHATSVDNERGIASGWRDSPLSEVGRLQARDLGTRRRADGIQAVFSSDLRRAVETAEIAFSGTQIPVFLDWRLRECDYGECSGMSREELRRGRGAHLDQPYPGGESWRQAVERVKRSIDDLPLRWEHSRVLVIGHIATRWAFEHYLDGVPLETLAQERFRWQAGWEYAI